MLGSDSAGSQENTRFLLCCIGSHIGALDLRHVLETMRPLHVVPVAGAPVFVLGLAIVRGFPTPIVDACRLLDCSASFRAQSASRFVSIRVGNRTAALAVDAVLEVRSLAASILADMPPLLRDGGSELVSAICSLDSKLLLVLEAARLLPEPLWNVIESPGIRA